MKHIYNNKEGKHEWIINTWYEKTMYILGVGYTILLAFAFLVGFVSAF